MAVEGLGAAFGIGLKSSHMWAAKAINELTSVDTSPPVSPRSSWIMVRSLELNERNHDVKLRALLILEKVHPTAG